MHAVGASAGDDRPTVGLLPWGDLFEDWLDPLGIDLDNFRDSFSGSWMFGWVEALKAAGVRTTIIAVTARVERPVSFEHAPTGASVYLLPPTRLSRRTGRLSTPPVRLARVLREERCAAVVCQEYETPRFDVAALLGRLQHRPTFATFQGGDYQVSRLERFARPLTMRAATGFVVPTRSEAVRVRDRYGVPDRRLARIFNPIDASFWRAEDRGAAREALNLPAAANVVAWHGQFHPRKGVDLLLRAWSTVRAARPERDLRLVLVGAGEQSGSELVAASGAEGVELIEEWVLDRARIRRILSAADIYAFPSRLEGFPVAPIEAMACGLPVVAANAPGISDIFDGGEASGGLVVPLGDVAAFSLALERVLDNETFACELGKRARRRVDERFSLAAVGEQLRSFLLQRGAAID